MEIWDEKDEIACSRKTATLQHRRISRTVFRLIEPKFLSLERARTPV
jgi:hypothetical protein